MEIEIVCILTRAVQAMIPSTRCWVLRTIQGAFGGSSCLVESKVSQAPWHHLDPETVVLGIQTAKVHLSVSVSAYLELRLFILRAYVNRHDNNRHQILPHKMPVTIVFAPYVFPNFGFVVSVIDKDVDRLPATLAFPTKEHAISPVGVLSLIFKVFKELRTRAPTCISFLGGIRITLWRCRVPVFACNGAEEVAIDAARLSPSLSISCKGRGCVAEEPAILSYHRLTRAKRKQETLESFVENRMELNQKTKWKGRQLD